MGIPLDTAAAIHTWIYTGASRDLKFKLLLQVKVALLLYYLSFLLTAGCLHKGYPFKNLREGGSGRFFRRHSIEFVIN